MTSWRPVRQPMRALVRPPGLADNAGTGRTSIWTHAEVRCVISNTSLLLAREPHPDKKNFALEHCQPAPSVGKPLEWRMNGHLFRYNWSLNIRKIDFHETLNRHGWWFMAFKYREEGLEITSRITSQFQEKLIWELSNWIDTHVEKLGLAVLTG